MGEARTCVILLFVLVQLQISSQSYFDSFICDFLCGDDDSFGICEDCSSEESSESTQSTTSKPTTSGPIIPAQNITIRIPASQGTILDILNLNGLWSVNVDAQTKPSATAATPIADASTTPKSATSESTTGASTTAAARR